MTTRTTSVLALGALLPALLLVACGAVPQSPPDPIRGPSVPVDPPASAPPTAAAAEPSMTALPAPSPSAQPAPPTNSSEPTPPAGPDAAPPLPELVVTPDGLGSLVIGEPIDPVLVTWNPEACRPSTHGEADPPAADPSWGAWLPNYPKVSGWGEFDVYPFEMHENPDRTVNWIRILAREIRTAEGIGLWSTETEILNTYPDVRMHDDRNSRLYWLDGIRGRVVMEVTKTGTGNDAFRPGDVFIFRVEPNDRPVDGMADTGVGGLCPLSA